MTSHALSRRILQSSFAPFAFASLVVLCSSAGIAPASEPGYPFDVAPFGYRDDAPDGSAHAVRWAEPRKIRRVEFEFEPGAAMPAADKVRLQYWHNTWNGQADPVLKECSPCAFGWVATDDWTNGKWKDADTELSVDGSRWVITFHPTDRTEFSELNGPGVGYRKTLKIRIVSDRAMPRLKALRALTDATMRSVSVRIAWDEPGATCMQAQTDRSGGLEVFNGAVQSIRPLADSGVCVDRDLHWTAVPNKAGGIEADLLVTANPIDETSDRTIVTLRTKQQPFSFAADEAIRGNRILVDDLGAMVTRADDPILLADYRKQRNEEARKTVYARVFDETEQTLQRAWNDMPARYQIWFVHGLPGNRNVVRQDRNGVIDIWKIDRWFHLPKSERDTERKSYDGEMLTLDFGLPTNEQQGGRELRDGYLPEVRTWAIDGPICYEQTTILDKLEPDLDKVRMDDPTVLLMRLRVVNVSASQQGTARFRLVSHANQPDRLVLDGDCVVAKHGGATAVRCLVKSDGHGTLKEDAGAIAWSVDLTPGQSQDFVAMMPTVAVTKAEIDALRQRDFDADSQRVCEFWERVAARGTQIETPEPWLNDFYKAHLLHEEITCVRDIEAPRRYAKASSCSYGVFPNESVMMIADLDRRGCHNFAEQCLQAFLDFQGTVPLPGNFKSQDGVFFGAGGWEHIGYNKHHGYVMWGMAEHWRFTHDRKWMEQAALKLIKSCDWITRERQTTLKANADGSRPIHYGLLPAGGLEDVQDYWYWLATNASAVWGFEAVADALADYGHKEAGRLKKEAEAYRADVFRAFDEAKVRSPVVRLRDGSYVPKYPSRVYERGRSVGWVRETLEGSICLPAMGLLASDAIQTKWILNDHEDNLYISDLYGYSIPTFEHFWFSRGGFSMQANLLDGPTCYLQRDEIKHFLRAFFNGFASAFFPEVRMLSEHSRPELGYPSGCHFKTPDEAQVCGWLRSMFVREQGDDLYLGQAIPRYWLANDQHVAIRNAATHFGPMSLAIQSRESADEIQARFTPPDRNPPGTIYLRLRHPQAKKIQSVLLNGRKYDRFDVDKEWIILPGDSKGPQEVTATY